MKLSDRLSAVAYMVPHWHRIADIGTDHAYLPISLLEDHDIPSAIATDIHTGPLEIARQHIAEAGFSDKIECRLGDGVSCIRPEEVDTVVIAGMGGDLIERMVTGDFPGYVLCPHSHVEKVRRKLASEGFVIEDEDMVCEDGKFYPVLQAVKSGAPYEMREPDAYFGPLLLRTKHPVLKAFLTKELEKFRNIPQQAAYLQLVKEALDEMQ